MLGTFLLLVVGVVAAALAITLLRFLFEIVVRLLLAVALAISVGVIGGAIAAYNGYDGGLSGLAVGFLALIPSLVAIWSWRGTVADRLKGRAPVAAPSVALIPLPQTPIERSLGLEDAEKLATAWLDAENLAGRSILGEPREACAQFLAAFEKADDCDLQAIELATLIRRHVPGIVSDTKAVLDGADAVERLEALAAMVTELQSLGHDAQEAFSRRHLAARERLDIRRSRFAARASEQGQSGSGLSSF